MTYNLVAPCYFGAEKTLSFEIKKAGGENINVTDGRVYFTGDAGVIASCNVRLRTAERVLVLLKSFEATTFDELFDGVYAIPFERYIPRDGAFPVKGASLKSQLSSVPTCQSIVKKAVVKRLQTAYKTQFLTERGRKFSLRFSIRSNMVEVFLDTSGEGLHKRGYRRVSSVAPLKETLAATICDIARVRGDSSVVDPCCGSGTLIIEAAQKALGIAPGLNRSFASERNGFVPQDVYNAAREAARADRRTDVTFKAVGYDIDDESLTIARNNAELAGVAGVCRFEKRNLYDNSFDANSIVIANPPYGERLGNEAEASAIIKHFGQEVQKSGAHAYIISPSQEFERLFGRKADRRRKLYNGMMMCQLYMYFNR